MRHLEKKHTKELSLDALLDDEDAFPVINDNMAVDDLASNNVFVKYLVKQGISKNEALAVMNHPKNEKDQDRLRLAEQALILGKDYGMPDYLRNGYIIADRGFDQVKKEIGLIKKLGAKPNQFYFIAEIIGYKSEPEIMDIAENIESFKELVEEDRFAENARATFEKYEILRNPEYILEMIAKPNIAPPEETEHRLNGTYYREGEYKDDPLNKVMLSDMREPGKALKFNHRR